MIQWKIPGLRGKPSSKLGSPAQNAMILKSFLHMIPLSFTIISITLTVVTLRTFLNFILIYIYYAQNCLADILSELWGVVHLAALQILFDTYHPSFVSFLIEVTN